MWPLALHITLQALRYDPEYPSLAPIWSTCPAHARDFGPIRETLGPLKDGAEPLRQFDLTNHHVLR
jgi:hypothetical protein